MLLSFLWGSDVSLSPSLHALPPAFPFSTLSLAASPSHIASPSLSPRYEKAHLSICKSQSFFRSFTGGRGEESSIASLVPREFRKENVCDLLHLLTPSSDTGVEEGEEEEA